MGCPQVLQGRPPLGAEQERPPPTEADVVFSVLVNVRGEIPGVERGVERGVEWHHMASHGRYKSK